MKHLQVRIEQVLELKNILNNLTIVDVDVLDPHTP